MSTAPSAFTAAQLEDQVRNLLSDNINFIPTAPDSLSPQTWSTQQVYDALNYAIKQYCVATNATWVEPIVVPTPNGVLTIPTDYLEVHNVYFPAGNVDTDGTPYRDPITTLSVISPT